MACVGEPEVSPPTPPDLTSPWTRPRIEWTTDPLDLGPGTHATVGVRTDGVAFVSWVGADLESTMWGALVEGGEFEAVDMGGRRLNHPQVRAIDEGWLAAASLDNPDGVKLTSIGADGLQLGAAEELAEVDGGYAPDLDVSGDDGRLVWSNFDALRCLRFTGVFEGLDDSACPSRVDPSREIGAATTRWSAEGPLYAWSEQNQQDGTFTVWLEAEGEPAVAVATGWGLDREGGRPALAVDGDLRQLAWRDASKGRVHGWLQVFDATGGPVSEPWPLRASSADEEVDRPTLDASDGVLIGGWQESGGVWVQVRHSDSGKPLGDPTRVADGERIAIDFTRGDEGVVGIVTWEDPATGHVGARWFAIEETAVR